ncbi:N-alpha-acetyltransferase 38, NatC auxiliary subunit [Drosophila persimilis]|nr:N-alpha-acetyltransferase 38, NatC auxiliary subunit [Drosophila persimilis]
MADPSENIYNLTSGQGTTMTPLYTIMMHAELDGQKQLGPEMAELLEWLGRCLKIVISDGRVLMGTFLQTDVDVNIVLGNCSEYPVGNGLPKFLGTVKVPCEHIVCMCIHGGP